MLVVGGRTDGRTGNSQIQRLLAKTFVYRIMMVTLPTITPHRQARQGSGGASPGHYAEARDPGKPPRACAARRLRRAAAWPEGVGLWVLGCFCCPGWPPCLLTLWVLGRFWRPCRSPCLLTLWVLGRFRGPCCPLWPLALAALALVDLLLAAQG